MASTLVDINQSCTYKVKVLDPYPTSVSIKQDTVIGRAEPIEDKPLTVVREEDASKSKS